MSYVAAQSYPAPGAAGAVRRPRRQSALTFGPVAAYFAGHVALALLLRRSQAVSALHVLVTIGLALKFAAAGRRRLVWVAYAGGYLAAVEVLWRMTNAPIPWETGKYAISVVFLLAILRGRLLKLPLLPLWFFGLLLCSVPLTIVYALPDEARALISFYMSGPLSLMFSAWFFSQIRLGREEAQKLFAIMTGPLVGIATLTLFSGLTATNLRFDAESNKVLSGGFAPNQVSAVLGLGAFLMLMCLLKAGGGKGLKVLSCVALLFLSAQSAMTFSRGGLYIAGGSAAAALVFMARDRRARLRVALSVALIFVSANFIVAPFLNSITGGALAARFKSIGTTGRDTLARNELQLFWENPLLGVGPGMAKYYRSPLWVGSHTEYTRVLAEHGMFGLTAILLLFVGGLRNVARARTNHGMAFAASVTSWSLLFMMSVAMRLAAPAFMYGLSFATLATPDAQPRASENGPARKQAGARLAVWPRRPRQQLSAPMSRAGKRAGAI